LKQVRRNYSDPNRGSTGKGVAKHLTLKHTCQGCSSKIECCPKTDARKITREEHNDALNLKPRFLRLKPLLFNRICPNQTFVINFEMTL